MILHLLRTVTCCWLLCVGKHQILCNESLKSTSNGWFSLENRSLITFIMWKHAETMCKSKLALNYLYGFDCGQIVVVLPPAFLSQQKRLIMPLNLFGDEKLHFNEMHDPLNYTLVWKFLIFLVVFHLYLRKTAQHKDSRHDTSNVKTLSSMWM